ncbi:HlyD family type I secretion periplasmic adaptor subunit, partial [Magnetococcales bacterium HHB-1]
MIEDKSAEPKLLDTATKKAPLPHQGETKPLTANEIDQEDVRKMTHVFLSALIVVCGGFLFWAHWGTLDMASLTEGTVVPFGQVKKVQHLEGGIVRKIMVAEGEQVKQGQPLVTLETAASDADVRELKVRIASLNMEILRLQAESEQKKMLQIDHKLTEQYPHQAEQVQTLFIARQKRLKNDLDGQKELIVQRSEDIAEIEGRLKNQQRQLKLVREQLKISERLLKNDLTNRYNHLDLMKEVNGLRGKIAADRIAKKRAEAALKEAEVRLKGILGSYKEEVESGLESAQREQAEYRARLRKYADNLSRTVLRAPVSGLVHTLYVVTEGGVVKSGETVLDIVPGGDRLVVDAKLPTQDIGYIRRGQKTIIRLASADASRFGDLAGKVV